VGGRSWAAAFLYEMKLKNTDFVDTMMAKVLLDLCFDLNQSLKLA
jgi:hypothetical protein